MTAFDTVETAIQSLKGHKLRAGLATLGIVVGVAAVVAMVAVAEGARSRVLERIGSLGANLLLIIPGEQKEKGVRLQAGSRRTLIDQDATAIMREIPDVTTAAPYISGRKRIVAGSANWSTTVAGVTPEYFEAREWQILKGQGLDASHERHGAKVALLGETVAKELFGEQNPVGETVRIDRTTLKVIGLLEPKGQDLAGRNQDDVVLMPLKTARVRIVGRAKIKPNAVKAILVKVYVADAMERVSREIKLLLRQRHRLLSSQRDDFRIQNLLQIVQTREAAYAQFTVLIALLASVSLVVGGIGVMNVMLVSVTERTSEIGIRLAVGAKQRDIRNQFLVEALILCILGGVLGLFLGMVAAVVVTNLVGWPTVLRADFALIALICAAGVGLVFGIFPASKAARLDPAEALRTE